MIILDTHTLVWLDTGNKLLGKQAIKAMDQALADNALAVSSITFWEVAMLANKARLKLDFTPDIWRKELIERGLIELPMDGETGIRAAELQEFHGDPADRIIVATALSTGSSLITADKKILDWSGLSQKIDARQ
ncbi:MAG: type II toxin-antitoxin system VapC family toxin [Mariprofundus sp.]|nr:type II toxin-antitoxin system VapC family toxin [Mariprofundus sp.]